MRMWVRALVPALILAVLAAGARAEDAENVKETSAIAEEAYIYGFPMIAAYKALYQFNLDKSSGEYKAPFNQIWNDAHVFTPKDTAIVTPNSDTPYSSVQADLRAEPIVLCVPEVEKDRYYSVQLADMYSFNYGYIGSRATGNGAGCYLVAGPNWTGNTPSGINQTFRSETQFSLIIFRTQLFDAADMENVKKVQAGYRVATLSSYLRQPAPPPAPTIDWPKFTEEAFTTDFPTFLDFLLQFCPAVAEETALRARFAGIGIGPDKKLAFKDLPPEQKAEFALGVKNGFAKIDKAAGEIGKEVNGWRVGTAAGNRAFFHGDWLLRAAGAKAGIYANDAAEAVYPYARSDGGKQPLDGSRHKYTLTFPANKLPPVNAFWSVTMYDGKTQLLTDNPIDRYLINSPMLPLMKTNRYGSVTIHIQKDPPAKADEANWLPAPDGPILLVMRLYWPKETPPSILPPGSGSWSPPPVRQAQ